MTTDVQQGEDGETYDDDDDNDYDNKIMGREQYETMMSEIYDSICSEISDELDSAYFYSEQYVVDEDQLAALEDFDVLAIKYVTTLLVLQVPFVFSEQIVLVL